MTGVTIMLGLRKKAEMPAAEDVLPGRTATMPVPARHFVLDAPLLPPFPEQTRLAMFGLGCFWGPEKQFWNLAGVYSTAAGYAGGLTPNPTYQEVCSGMTGHNEVVQVVYFPDQIEFSALLTASWEMHDPTQGMRQGNDVGTQYRSGVYILGAEQKALAESSRAAYQARLQSVGYGTISTEILRAPTFYYAEDYHQQYLAKNPHGYCGLGGTGVSCAA